jgi:hypothetical protein
MSSYQNRLGAFQNSVAESKAETDNFLSRKTSAIAENATLLSSAKGLAKAKVTADEMRGISIEGGIRLVKPLAQRGISWADKKFLSGRVERDTKNFGSWAKGKGQEVKKSLQTKWKERNQSNPEETKPAEETSKIGDERTPVETDDAPVSKGGEVEMTDRGESKFRDMKDYGQETEMKPMTESGTYAKMPEEGTASYDEVPDWVKGSGNMGMRDEYTDSGVEESKEEEPTESSSKVTDTEGGESGATEETSTDAGGTYAKMPDKSEGEDDIGDVAKTGAEDETTEEVTGEGLEVAGTALDATGIGAVVGVPLQIAGAVLEGAGIYEAGKSIVDWFKDDVLGDKPKINAPTVAMPKAISTLAGKGLQATPTFDTTMDLAGGVGGW